jgi:rubrerythrin
MPDLAAGNQVLELAIRMEEIARDFYESLALASNDAKVRQFCLEACRQEAAHWTTFRTLREQWTRGNQSRLLPEATLETLSALARQQSCPDPGKVRDVALTGTLASALDMALEMERGAIRFYEDMRGNLPALTDTLDSILAEERTHASKLQALAKTVAAAR